PTLGDITNDSRRAAPTAASSTWSALDQSLTTMSASAIRARTASCVRAAGKATSRLGIPANQPRTRSSGAGASDSRTHGDPSVMTRGPALTGDEFAAVDRDDVAADPVRVGRAEGHDRVRDVLRRRHPPVRIAREGHVD